MSCRICGNPSSYENEQHTFSCEKLTEGMVVNKNIKFEHIYGDLNLQVEAMKEFMPIIRKRNLILELKNSK